MDYAKSRGVYNAFIVWIRFALPASYLSCNQRALALWVAVRS
jgi:hypothetical protein